MTEKAIERAVESLNLVLAQCETAESFCIAHELVIRNRITNKASKIAKAASQRELPPFYFFVNKN